MKTRSTLLAIYALLLLSSPAKAEQGHFSGEQIHDLCTKERNYDFVAAYVTGIVDGFLFMKETAQQEGAASATINAVCLPKGGVSGNTLGDLVCKFVKEHPEKRQYSAASQVWLAVVKAYGAGCL